MTISTSHTIAQIVVLGNRTNPTATIIQAFGKQVGDTFEKGDLGKGSSIIAATGVRAADISCLTLPGIPGPTIIINIIEANAPEWQWNPQPTAELMQVLESQQQAQAAGPTTFVMRTDGTLGQSADQVATLVEKYQDELFTALAQAQSNRVRTQSLELLKHAPISQRLRDALLWALNDSYQSVRLLAGFGLMDRIFIWHNEGFDLPLEPIIKQLSAPYYRDRELAAMVLYPLTNSAENRATIRKHAFEVLRALANDFSYNFFNRARAVVDMLELDEPAKITTDEQQTAALTTTLEELVQAGSLDDMHPFLDPDPTAPIHRNIGFWPFPQLFEPLDDGALLMPPLIQQLAESITLHTATPAEDGRVRFLARRENRGSIRPLSGEARWNGAHWLIWKLSY